MKYQLLQIRLTDAEVDKINAEGHNAVDKQKLKLDMKLKATFEKFADVTVLCFEPLGEMS